MATPPEGPTHLPTPHPDDGAKLYDIVRYVMKRTKYAEDRALNAVLEVLNIGLATKRIIKTPYKKYVLIESRPVSINYKIKEPRLSDDSSDSSDQ